MTAHELAALLLTYPDLPIKTMIVFEGEDGEQVGAMEAEAHVALEIHTSLVGERSVAVVATTPIAEMVV